MGGKCMVIQKEVVILHLKRFNYHNDADAIPITDYLSQENTKFAGKTGRIALLLSI